MSHDSSEIILICFLFTFIWDFFDKWHFGEIKIFCSICSFIHTFDQLNTSLLNKSINSNKFSAIQSLVHTIKTTQFTYNLGFIVWFMFELSHLFSLIQYFFLYYIFFFFASIQIRLENPWRRMIQFSQWTGHQRSQLQTSVYRRTAVLSRSILFTEETEQDIPKGRHNL